MTIRKIIKIDEDKCNGCGQCVPSCAEGAIQIIDGKARLVSEVYCDGLGSCLGKCPMDAITIEEREAEAFDEQKARTHVESMHTHAVTPCGCPSSHPQVIETQCVNCSGHPSIPQFSTPSQLQNWPVQLRLVPQNAPFFHDADLLLSADCSAFAYGDFHRKILAGKVVLISCPKLDDTQGYVEKLAEIVKQARSVTVVRMEVPCCGGIVRMAEQAIALSGRELELKVKTVMINGELQE